MKPILYSPTETQFSTNGIGILADAVSCLITEELNNSFELVLTYPVDGIWYSSIEQRSLILAKPNSIDAAQPFRVYRITKPLNGIVTIYAAHISYDLSGIPVAPFTAGSLQAALSAISSNSVITNPFNFWSDITTSLDIEAASPASARSILGNVISLFGGECEFDRYDVKLHSARGLNRGVSIRYGKNLTSLEQDENCSEVYTGVYPYWSGNDVFMDLTPKVVNVDGVFDYVKVLPVDLSGEFSEQPSNAELLAAAQTYISNNNIGIPKVSLTLSFVQLEKTTEYANTSLLEQVCLGDTVSVIFSKLGVSANAKCVKTIYDVLADRFDSVELGNAKKTVADTISSQNKEIANLPQRTAFQEAIMNATNLITGNKGGYVILHSSTGAAWPDEILILDSQSGGVLENALHIWRWNNSGLGYSSTGYTGPFSPAITSDGQIVADFITTGGMDAARITSGLIKSSNLIESGGVVTQGMKIDLSSGAILAKNTRIKADGTFEAINGIFSGDVDADTGQMGVLFGGANSGSVNGDFTVNGKLEITGEMGVKSENKLRVTDGISWYDLLIVGQPDYEDDSPTGQNYKNVLMQSLSSSLPLYSAPRTSSPTINGVALTTTRYYTYDETEMGSDGRVTWFHVNGSCTYSGGTVSSWNPLIKSGWANLIPDVNVTLYPSRPVS